MAAKRLRRPRRFDAYLPVCLNIPAFANLEEKEWIARARETGRVTVQLTLDLRQAPEDQAEKVLRLVKKLRYAVAWQEKDRLRRRVLDLRAKRRRDGSPLYSAEKIADVLKAEGVKVSDSTVKKILFGARRPQRPTEGPVASAEEFANLPGVLVVK